jgi:hypothetical protein
MPPGTPQEAWTGIIGRLLNRKHPNSAARAGDAQPPVPDARLLGLRMTALYQRWQNTDGPDLVRLTEALITHVGLAVDTPIARTCLEAAAAVRRWRGCEYHSARHHAEVATNAMVLATISAQLGCHTPPHDLGILLAAALAHDIDLEPATAKQVRFEAESKSAAALDAIAASCGVGDDDRHAMHLLVMATEPHSRAGIAALLAGQDGADGALPDPLARLATDQRLLKLAGLISDADLLSSAGLTRAWTRVQEQRLEREINAPIADADWHQFFDTIVGRDFLSRGGRHFAANLAHIRKSRPPLAPP